MTGRRSRAATLVVLSGFAVCHSSSGASAWGNVPLGTKIPELTLTSTAGKRIKISARGSKALVLLYIRPNHERSSRALAELTQLYHHYKNKGLAAIAVSTVRGEVLALTRLTARLKVPFPVLIDSNEEFYGRYGVFVHPTTGVIDAKGVLRYEYSSHRKGYFIAVERQVKAVLGLGPQPAEINDADRHAVSPAELKRQRQDRMSRMRRRLQLIRARRRLRASRAILNEQNLPFVLKLYRTWESRLPPPRHPLLAELSSRVTAGDDLKGVCAKLQQLTHQRPRMNEAWFWLGRAAKLQNRSGDALKAFHHCAKDGPLAGPCNFELAGAVAAANAAKAVTLCRRGFAHLFDKP